MSKTRFVAFATQKGGIGKSTITALVANYFHNVKGFNVAVIDCDEPQYNRRPERRGTGTHQKQRLFQGASL